MGHKNNLAEIGQMALVKYYMYQAMAKYATFYADFNKYTRTANNYYQVYLRNALNQQS